MFIKKSIIYIIDELKKLFTLNNSKISWQTPLAAAFSIGIPLLFGAYYNHIDYALLTSIGGLVFLYMPNTNLVHRIIVLFCCSYGLILCFMLGMFANMYPSLIVLFITILTIVVSMICSYVKLAPPGNYFFIMTFSIAAFMPSSFTKTITSIGLVFLGTTLACIIGIIFSLIMLRINKEIRQPHTAEKDFDIVIVDSIITGVVIGLSIFIAQMLDFSRPYWVGLSALAVLRGISYHIILTNHFQRIVGTFIGLILTFYLLPLEHNPWLLSFSLMLFVFVGLFTMTRNLALSILFFTPLSIFLAEVGNLHTDTFELVQSRLLDTILGGTIGILGGYIFHYEKAYNSISKGIKNIINFLFNKSIA